MAKGRSAQDIVRASKLKAYRSKLASAKRLGVVSARIDARSHKPTRYMKARLKSLEPVLEGRYAAVKAKPSVLREFRAAGATIRNGRILVEARPEVVTSVRKGTITEGVIFQRRPLSQGYFEEEVTFPVSSHNVGDMLSFIDQHAKALQSRKNSGDQWGFKIEGHRSRATFGGLEEMIDYLRMYVNIGNIEQVDTDDSPQFLTVYRVVNNRVWTAQPRYRAARIYTPQDRRGRPLNKKPPGKSMAERKAAQRERMSPEAREQEKATTRARVAALRATRKGK